MAPNEEEAGGRRLEVCQAQPDAVVKANDSRPRQEGSNKKGEVGVTSGTTGIRCVSILRSDSRCKDCWDEKMLERYSLADVVVVVKKMKLSLKLKIDVKTLRSWSVNSLLPRYRFTLPLTLAVVQ